MKDTERDNDEAMETHASAGGLTATTVAHVTVATPSERDEAEARRAAELAEEARRRAVIDRPYRYARGTRDRGRASW